MCERTSDMHICYLDARAAFDNVLTTGLIHKLYNLGIKGSLLRIINNTFQGTSSRDLYNAYLSGNQTRKYLRAILLHHVR